MKALILTPLFIAALFIIAKVWKQPKCPLVNEWYETDLEYICTGYYSVKKKKKVCYWTWESMMLSEISHIEKDKFCTSGL